MSIAPVDLTLWPTTRNRVTNRDHVDIHPSPFTRMSRPQLEESVQVLTAQLDDARRQLGQAAYYNSQRPPGALPHGPPLSPQSKDFTQLQSENAYLRDENADLRRQLYSYRVNYPPHTPVEGKEGWEVKPDGGNGGGFGVYPGGGMSPRRSGVSRASGDMPGVVGQPFTCW